MYGESSLVVGVGNRHARVVRHNGRCRVEPIHVLRPTFAHSRKHARAARSWSVEHVATPGPLLR